MTEQEKKLLLRDLSARLPYGVKATTTSNGWNGTYTITGYNNDRIYLDCPIYDEGDDEWLVESVKPYLRPMSSMTEEEYREFDDILRYGYGDNDKDYEFGSDVDWLNSHHFDYRGLIEKGLALEAKEGMYENIGKTS